MARTKTHVNGGIAPTLAALRRALGWDEATLRRWRDAGVIAEEGPWSVAKIRQAVMDIPDDQEPLSGRDLAADKLKWDALRSKEQALKAQRERQALEGLYVSREDHEAIRLAIVRRFVGSVDGAGHKLAPLLVGVESVAEAARIVDDYFRGLRAQLAAVEGDAE